jgi:hypothetical protein
VRINHVRIADPGPLLAKIEAASVGATGAVRRRTAGAMTAPVAIAAESAETPVGVRAADVRLRVLPRSNSKS